MRIQTETKYFSIMIVFVGVLACGLLFGTGCNEQDDTAEMAAQMQSMRSKSQSKRDQANAAPTKPVPGQPPVGENPCAPDGEPEEPVIPAYTGPKVLVKDFEVRLPYPEFDGAGRYDIKCWVQSEVPVSSSTVWEVIARGPEGTEVGSKELHLVIYDSYYKPLDLNSFYCKSVPASLEFQATEKTPSKTGETGSADGGGKKGGGRGGNAVTPGV